MSQRIEIEAEERQIVGKKVKRLRAAGWIPATIYGQQESVNVKMENLQLSRMLRHAGSGDLIEISVGGDKRIVLAREIQRHITRGDLIHVDFYEVNLKEVTTSEAALVTIGESPMDETGLGTVTQVEYDVIIEALPDDLISEIIIDLSLILDADDTITLGDLKVPAGVTIIGDMEMVVAKFDYAREEVEEVEEDEFAEGEEGEEEGDEESEEESDE